MRPRRDRWVSIPEVLDSLAKKFPAFLQKLEGRPRKRQLEAVRRLVRRVERRDSWRYTKRVDGALFVKVDALEALLPADIETVSALEHNLADLNQRHRGLQRQVNGQGARLREHDEQIANLREIQQHLLESQAAQSKAIALIGRVRGAP